MALHYEWKDCENWRDMSEGLRRAIVFSTMYVGIARITEENWETFAIRLRMWDMAVGNSGDECIPIQAIKKAVGLYTNASTLTDSQFNKKIVEAMKRYASASVDRVAREAEEA